MNAHHPKQFQYPQRIDGGFKLAVVEFIETAVSGFSILSGSMVGSSPFVQAKKSIVGKLLLCCEPLRPSWGHFFCIQRFDLHLFLCFFRKPRFVEKQALFAKPSCLLALPSHTTSLQNLLNSQARHLLRFGVGSGMISVCNMRCIDSSVRSSFSRNACVNFTSSARLLEMK